MFLVKLAFWGSLVVLLLPTGQADTAKDAQIDTVEALSAVSATFADMRQFCVRQPKTCEVGNQALSAFGQKAQASAALIYRYLSAPKPADDLPTASIPDTHPSAIADAQNTLTASDRATPWRGPMPRPAPRTREPS